MEYRTSSKTDHSRMGRFLWHIRKRTNRKYAKILIVVSAIIVLIVFLRGGNSKQLGSKRNLYISLFGETFLPEPTQKDIDYFSQHVQLNYSVLDNFVSGERMGYKGHYIAQISLRNTGSDVIRAKRWQLYGYMMRFVEPNLYPYPDGYYLEQCGLKMFHVGGGLYRLEPVGKLYKKINPKETLLCRIAAQGFEVEKFEAMPNWYITGQDTIAKTIENTKGEDLSFVSDYTLRNQYSRRYDDPFHPYSPPESYKLYSASKEPQSTGLRILPTPFEFETEPIRTLEWNTNTWVICKSAEFKNEIKYLSEKMKMKIVASKPVRKYIIFIRGEVKPKKETIKITDEAYAIKTDPDQNVITITTQTPKGAFNAIQTLRNLVFSPEAGTGTGLMLNVPAFTVTDAPRFSYRGLHIDVARNFHGKEQIKKMIDAMAMYKMNKLHLHLSDDEGWRLEIPALPELTFIGSQRCHDPDEEQCILPALGSGPDVNTSGSGYYTVTDYKEILTYADERHIEVIPEFDMPGHSRAAIKSIHAKSQQSHRKIMKAEQYAIIEDGDKSDYKSGQHFKDDVMNPCLTSTYKFVKKVISELVNMHKDIQPLNEYHFGGDEVAKDAWAKSKACKDLKKKQPEISTEYDIMQYFIKNVVAIATEQNLAIGTWEDGMISHGGVNKETGIPFTRTSFQNKDIYVYVWKRPTEDKTPHRARLFANNGYKVILAYGSYLYLDHAHEPHPEERGLYWATRKISTEDVWNFTPGVMNSDLHLKCPACITDQSDCFTLKKPENIVGMQAELWSETVRTGEQMDYMLFPRLLAVAERAWHKASWEDVNSDADNKNKHRDWVDFVNVVGSRELRKLEHAGIQYRVSPPGAVVENGKVRFSTEFPGFDVEYFASVEEQWLPVSHNMPIKGTMKIRTRSLDRKRYSRVITVEPWNTDTSDGKSLNINGSLFVFFNYFLVIVLNMRIIK